MTTTKTHRGYIATRFYAESTRDVIKGFEPGIQLRRVMNATGLYVDKDVDLEARTPEHVADELYAKYNRDDRPDGQRERSMSIGDVVAVTERAYLGDPATTVYLAVGSIGWYEVAEADVLAACTNKAHPDVCCSRAKVIPCVCSVSFKCDMHGGGCRGSHD